MAMTSRYWLHSWRTQSSLKRVKLWPQSLPPKTMMSSVNPAETSSGSSQSGRWSSEIDRILVCKAVQPVGGVLAAGEEAIIGIGVVGHSKVGRRDGNWILWIARRGGGAGPNEFVVAAMVEFQRGIERIDDAGG